MENQNQIVNGSVKQQDRLLTQQEYVPAIIEDAKREISIANAQVRDIVQNNTEALREALQSIITMTHGKDFRVRIEEEINIIERP